MKDLISGRRHGYVYRNCNSKFNMKLVVNEPGCSILCPIRETALTWINLIILPEIRISLVKSLPLNLIGTYSLKGRCNSNDFSGLLL